MTVLIDSRNFSPLVSSGLSRNRGKVDDPFQGEPDVKDIVTCPCPCPAKGCRHGHGHGSRFTPRHVLQRIAVKLPAEIAAPRFFAIPTGP